MKLILFVSSMGAGGAERVAATLVNAWCRKGYEVTLLSTFSGRGECFYELHPSSRLVYLADLAKNGSKPSFRLYLSRLFALRKFVRVESPDTLVSFLPNVNIMVLGATLGLRKHTIICERTDPFQMPVNWALRFLRILMYPLASRFVVQTEAVKRKYNALWRPLPDITCIGNPIPEHLTEYKSLPKKDSSSKILLAVGRLSEEKCFDRLIDAFYRVAPKHPEWQLRLVGEGPMRSSLEFKVTKLGMSEHIQLPGRTATVELELMQADAFALTSRFEGFPNALLEAMAVGLPCISVDCPSGPYEITDEGKAALLVPPNNLDALCNGLETLMGNSELREQLSQRARASVFGRFSLDRITTQWEQVIRPE